MENRDFKHLPPGSRLQWGNYVIERSIGQGGFGITYIAHHTKLNRKCCVKEYYIDGRCVRNTQHLTVHAQGISEESFAKYRRQFLIEAQTLEKMNHPGIVKIIDVFDENNTSYMVMPFIEGRTLEEVVSGHQGGRLPYEEAMNYIAQAADALEYVHSYHILHRDVKPANIMITPDARAILIDFGNARNFEQNKTVKQTKIFTEQYAALEQHSEVSRKGAYTDIYGLGGSFYFALTGQHPVSAPERLQADGQPMPAPRQLFKDIPKDCSRACMKAMQLQPQNRPQNVQEFLDDLFGKRPSKYVEEKLGSGKSNTGKIIFFSVLGTVALAIALFFLLGGGKTAIVPIAHQEKTCTDSVEERDFTGGCYNMVKVTGFQSGDFWIGQTEVTQRFWDQFSEKKSKEICKYHGDSLPVESVSYEQVLEFIKILNTKLQGKLEEMKFALPTEEQWEYAAKGGQCKKDYKYSGSGSPDLIAWYEGNADTTTHEVAKLKPNTLKIYDMSGNVAEYITEELVKGGAFTDYKEQLSISENLPPDERKYTRGFRLILQ